MIIRVKHYGTEIEIDEQLKESSIKWTSTEIIRLLQEITNSIAKMNHEEN